jgi:nicotinamide-nucleotide amidase
LAVGLHLEQPHVRVGAATRSSSHSTMFTVDLIAVGNEVLYGEVVDTNSSYLAARLFENGLEVGRHVTVGDDIASIVGELRRSLETSQAVIMTGGLGPTPDDRTREALAELTQKPLESLPELVERIRQIFVKRGIPMPEVNLRQARIPAGAAYIPQKLGTAPGIIVEVDSARVYALPGVPHEMREMFERAVLPDLLERSDGVSEVAVKVLKIWGLSESALASQLGDLERALSARAADCGATLDIAYLPTLTELRLKVVCRSEDGRLGVCKQLVDEATQEIRRRLGDNVFGEDDESLVEILDRLVRQKGLTLCCAESLTGGMVGETITRLPGVSAWFKGSAVTYWPEAKQKILRVPKQVIEKDGVVSARCAEEMAEGARKLFDADIGIACTGEAGPKPQEAEVGQVYMAVATPEGRRSIGVRLPGDRERIRTYTTTSLLDFTRRYLAATTLGSEATRGK